MKEVRPWMTLGVVLSLFFGAQSASAYTNVRKVNISGVEISYRLQAPQGVLYTASQPTPASFADIKQLGVKSILNIREPSEMKFDEAKVVTDLGMRYHSLPVTPAKLGKELDAQYTIFLNDPENFPMFVHCATANRSAALLAAHEILSDHVEPQKAIADAEKYGLTKFELKGILLNLKPQAELPEPAPGRPSDP